MFRKKTVEKYVTFYKAVDVLNFVPREYTVKRRWALFSDPDRFSHIHRRKLAGLNADEMNGDMFDASIDGEAALMKTWADEQHILHNTLIEHNAGILAGKVNGLNRMLEGFREDLEKIDKSAAELEAIRKGVNND